MYTIIINEHMQIYICIDLCMYSYLHTWHMNKNILWYIYIYIYSIYILLIFTAYIYILYLYTGYLAHTVYRSTLLPCHPSSTARHPALFRSLKARRIPAIAHPFEASVSRRLSSQNAGTQTAPETSGLMDGYSILFPQIWFLIDFDFFTHPQMGNVASKNGGTWGLSQAKNGDFNSIYTRANSLWRIR